MHYPKNFNPDDPGADSDVSELVNNPAMIGGRGSTKFCEDVGISKSKFWSEIRQGRLQVQYIGNRVFVSNLNAARWQRGLPTARSNAA